MVIRPFLILLLAVGGACSSREPAGESAESLIRQMAQEFRPRSSTGPDGRPVLTSMGFSRFGISNPHLTTWIDETMAEERKLLSLGSAAVFPIGMALLSGDSPRDLRARLAVLLGRLGDVGGARFLYKVIDEDPDAFLRECCLTGVGLLKSPGDIDRLSSYLGPDRVRKQVVHWAMGMGGREASRDQSLALCREALQAEICEDPLSGFPVRQLGLGPGDRHARLEARVTPENEDLSLDLWRASQFHSREVVGLLISALRYHNSWVQHMALAKLLDLVEAPASLQGIDEYDLHSLQKHQAWSEWWRRCEPKLRWNDATRKFSGDAPQE